MRKLSCAAISALSLTFAASHVNSAEYCFTKYEAKISAANADLGAALKRIAVLEPQISAAQTRKAAAATELADIASKNPSDPKIQTLAAEIRELDKNIAVLSTEVFTLQDKIVSLKGSVPSELAGELRGCIEATRPANTFVNVTIQALAAISTGGASFLLPPKALYVDMSAVLNGYPMGGPDSLVVKGRNDAAKALGIDLENDNGFIGNAIKNPLQPWTW